jgi:hypothetical protein
MPAITYYLGRPASFWIEVMSRRPARAAAANQTPDASPVGPQSDAQAVRRRMQGVPNFRAVAAECASARTGHATGSTRTGSPPRARARNFGVS